ncbi:MAG TPA: DUF998 domain-containing protein [Kofleriaceae bacterium]|jgi:hypothetical membrane protein
MSAYRRGGWLRVAAVQFVVLTAIAMALYAGGTWLDPTTPHYQLAHNFFSDLGATRAFSGRSNYASAALFAIALVTIGGALVAFAWTWRELAIEQRARWAGIASVAFGTASGLAFAGIGLAPIDHALALHNHLVFTAFGCLLGYVACLTIVIWRNHLPGLAINAAYVVLVLGYVWLVAAGPRALAVQVIGQKTIVYASMLHIMYLTTLVRRVTSRQLG